MFAFSIDATRPIAISFLVAMLAATNAAAQDSRQRNAGPDEADLRLYFECSAVSKTRVLSFNEAQGCTRAYTRIKLSFVTGIGIDEFDALSSQEMAAVNRLGYKRYVEWRRQNAPQVDALSTTPLSSSKFAED